jgi:hypothetical protein
MPDLAANRGDGIAEGAVRLGVPGRGSGRERPSGGQIVRPESDEREQAEQRRSGADDREVGPLALGFDAEMGTVFLEGDLERPAGDEPLEDIDRSGAKIGAEEGLRRELAARIADQQPADRHGGKPLWYQTAVPVAISTRRLVRPYQRGTVWRCQMVLGVVQDLAERGQALAVNRRSSAARAFGRRGGIQTGVKPQPGDNADIAANRGEEADGGKSGVADEHDAAAGQPAVDLQEPAPAKALGESHL